MKRTKDGKKIEMWVKNRKGVPSKIKGTKDLVKIKFDSMEDRLVPITWYDFFQILKDIHQAICPIPVKKLKVKR